MTPTPPTIGRIVHVRIHLITDDEPTLVPAIVTAVRDHGEISCTAFPPSGSSFAMGVVFQDESRTTVRTWSWPKVMR